MGVPTQRSQESHTTTHLHIVAIGFAVRSTSSFHISMVPEAGTRLIERQMRELGYIGKKRKTWERLSKS